MLVTMYELKQFYGCDRRTYDERNFSILWKKFYEIIYHRTFKHFCNILAAYRMEYLCRYKDKKHANLIIS
jgi:hypothetical protein